MADAAPALRDLYAQVAAASPYQHCALCHRRLNNMPDDPESSAVRDMCWGCFVLSFRDYQGQPKKDFSMAATSSTAKSRAWTYSKLSCFESCPRVYGERYVYNRLPYTESPQQKEGKRQHQQLRLRLASQPIPLPADMQQFEPLCASIMGKGAIVHVELQAAITKDMKPAEYWAEEGWARGDIDVVIMGPASAAALDWKTGNPDFEQPFQLEMYAVFLMVRFPHLQSVSVANVWLKTGKVGTVRVYTRATDFPRIAADMYRRWDTVERATAAGSFPPTPNPFCKGCDVKSCEYRRERAAA